MDDIPFELPVDSEDSPAIMAAFPINAARAAELLPGRQLHPFRVWGDTGLLMITVIDYHTTDIGSYIEFSIGIACTRGRRPAPAVVPMLFRESYGLGQYVYDLPVSTEISVKGGRASGACPSTGPTWTS